jgi:hypothetical protein
MRAKVSMSVGTFLICFVCFAASTSASANTISHTVVSGQPTRVAAYHSWDPENNCAFRTVTMNVSVRPTHGTLVPRVALHTIATTRFGAGGLSKCTGKQTKALEIYYRSNTGFHGTDTFTIDVIFGWQNRHDIDNYLINVP